MYYVGLRYWVNTKIAIKEARTAHIQFVHQVSSSMDVGSSEAVVVVAEVLLDDLLQTTLVSVVGELKERISLKAVTFSMFCVYKAVQQQAL